MLITMNTTRPMCIDGSLVARYVCTDCGEWCTVIYDAAEIKWDDNDDTEEKVDVDRTTETEEVYFVGIK